MIKIGINKIVCFLVLIIIISLVVSCTAENNVAELIELSTFVTIETLTESSIKEVPIIHESFYTKELSRNDDYKLMEMYVYDENMNMI